MPAFTAIAFDSLIEPGSSRPMGPLDYKLERTNSTPSSRVDRGSNLDRGVSVPPNVKLDAADGTVPSESNQDRGVNIPPVPRNGRRNGMMSTKNASGVDRKHHWTQISPALYATPESTPLPDAPSSFPPSPYIINHKRRGPRLVKSLSEEDVGTCEQMDGGDTTVDGNGNSAEMEMGSDTKGKDVILSEVVDCAVDDEFISTSDGDVHFNGAENDRSASVVSINGSTSQNGVPKSVAFDLLQNSEVDDFVDPLDTMSVKSFTESESNAGAERSLNSTTPLAEFYDAWEELSTEIGPQPPLMPDFETELRETRLSLLMEIEKRKQVEENLSNMRNQWQRICEQLSLEGLTLPLSPTMLPEGDQVADPAAEVLQQVYLARFVSNSIGRGMAKAEVEMEMEAHIKLKNAEIARLWDRLHYYEAVNQEMSQRNQEVVETARRVRQRRKRRQRWVWGSVATLVTMGSAAFAYSYFQGGKGSSSSHSAASVPEVDHDPK